MIDCSTIDVESARPVHRSSVDAPVSGGVAGARGATLTFMAGGETESFVTAKPFLEAMGKKIIHCDGNGAGQVAKICNNMILGAFDDRGERGVRACGKARAIVRRCSMSP